MYTPIFEWCCLSLKLRENSSLYPLIQYGLMAFLAAFWIYLFFTKIRSQRYKYLTGRSYAKDHHQYNKTYTELVELRYNEDKYLINEMQQKQLHRDKIKYSYIMNHYKIPILYLWETDINKAPDMCLELIKKYIQNNKILGNYHSFNWQLENNNLSIKRDVIIPYQDMSVNEYRRLIKKKVG